MKLLWQCDSSSGGKAALAKRKHPLTTSPWALGLIIHTHTHTHTRERKNNFTTSRFLYMSLYSTHTLFLSFCIVNYFTCSFRPIHFSHITLSKPSSTNPNTHTLEVLHWGDAGRREISSVYAFLNTAVCRCVPTVLKVMHSGTHTTVHMNTT